MNDEIKIQKMGLCTHFSKKMFHVEHLEGEKIIMKDLFYQVPELDDCFTFINECNIIHILKKYRICHSFIYSRSIPFNIRQFHTSIKR